MNFQWFPEPVIFHNGAVGIAWDKNTTYVGVGTVSPSAKLHVYGSNNNSATYTNGDAVGGSLYLQDSGAGGGNGGQILFGSNFGISAGIKMYLTNGTGPQGRLLLQTRNSTGNVENRITVNYDGRVSVNGSAGSTYTPIEMLDVVVGSGTGQMTDLGFRCTDGGANAKNIKFGVNTGGNGYGYIQYTYENVAHGTLALSPIAGNVGVGLTTATAWLHLKAGTATENTAPFKFTSGTNLTTAEAGAVEYDGNKYYVTDGSTLRAPLLRTLFTSTADATVANTVTETTVVGTGVGSLALPANALIAGRTLRLRWLGYVSSTGSPTLQFRVKLGGTVVCNLSTTTIATATNYMVECEAIVTCRTTGAGGTTYAQGVGTLRGGAAWATAATATVTVNTTGSLTIDVMGTWSAASSSNTVTITNLVAEVLN